MLKINLEFQKGILFVRLKGNLDKVTSKKLNNYLLPIIINYKVKYLVYNFSKVFYIDSIAKQNLLKEIKAINKNKGLFCGCNIPFNLYKNFNSLPILKLESEKEVLKTIVL